MACRADPRDWRDPALSFGVAGARWSCRGPQAPLAGAAADVTMARLSTALAPVDAGAVSAGILDRLREHHYLPPVAATDEP